eukprot:5755034-Lingulodinium_polyedra.AAC.1
MSCDPNIVAIAISESCDPNVRPCGSSTPAPIVGLVFTFITSRAIGMLRFEPRDSEAPWQTCKSELLRGASHDSGPLRLDADGHPCARRPDLRSELAAVLAVFESAVGFAVGTGCARARGTVLICREAPAGE